ncbi:class A beta-lactamase-related serine hydrolase [Marinicauda algicola]|uniref:Class A beta-lactamase-related serine hydrolase n=1 Tax=Marinicauda algicola TaxID=2029849 RepID=A0A4S2GZD5_9PROT|nr:serine hydrolase domain-containing protein [Marinicauda algicola]TGY88577.1 class A beta-lactamase-related serine hydrolase [Marinicauda algicola]
MLHRSWLVLALASAITLSACGPREPERQAPVPAQAAVTPAAPERSLDADALAALDARLEALAAAQERSGFVAILARDGEVVHVSEAGHADIAAGREMTADTVVRVASMTKPVTAVAIMMLVQDGTIALDDPVSDYIPAFAEARVATSLTRDEAYEIPTEPLARPITIRDLLTHTSGIGYIFDYETNLGALYLGHNIYEMEGTMDERMETLAGLPLYFQPGERWFYSYANDVLGRVVEVASGQRLEAFMDARIFTPLGMEDTSFFLTPELEARLATLYTHGEDGALVAVPVENDLIRYTDIEAGGAGLFSTANDYIRFAMMLANGGELDGVRLLEAETVADMVTAHVGLDRMPEAMRARNLAYGYGLGVYVADAPEGSARAGDFGWGGYFDTDFFVSPATGLAGVVMAQEEPGPTTSETIGARAVFRTLAAQAVEEGVEG